MLNVTCMTVIAAVVVGDVCVNNLVQTNALSVDRMGKEEKKEITL